MLFQSDNQLTAEQFYREQTNGGITTIAALITQLRSYNKITIDAITDNVCEHLKNFLGCQPLVIAVDEAQIAALILPNRFISLNAKLKTRPLLDERNILIEKYARGLLTPLCESLCTKRATLIILGTLTIQHAEQIYSAVGKPTSFERIFKFILVNNEGVETILKRQINLDDCDFQCNK